MKKAFTVLSLILVFAFVLVSCEEGLPDGLTKIMGAMGNNVLGADISKVEGAVDDAKPTSFDFDGVITVAGQDVEFDKANGKIKIGKFEIKDVDFPEAMMLPSENLSSIIDVLESNAGDELRKQLSEPVDPEDLDAVKGTASLISSALDAALGAGSDPDDPTVQTLQSIKESLTLPEGKEYTKADALFLQAMTNVVFSAAEVVSDLQNETEPDVAQMTEDVYPGLMALNSISQNSGSNLSLDLAGIVDQLSK